METRLAYSEPDLGLRKEPNPLERESLRLLSSVKTPDTPEVKVKTTAAEREFATALEKFAVNNFKKMDHNNDGFLSQAEVALYNLRDDLSESEKVFGRFIASNYKDLSNLADYGSPFSKGRFQFNLKKNSELCITDFKVLRNVSDQKSLQEELNKAKSDLAIHDYVNQPTAWSTGGGIILAEGVGLVAGRRIPLLAAGALAGGYAGYKIDEYLKSDTDANHGRISSYCGIGLGAGGGMLLSTALGQALGKRLPLLVIGGALGFYGAYKGVEYFREKYHHPGCVDYYEKKRDLAKSILERNPR